MATHRSASQGSYFEIDQKILAESEKWKELKRRAEERKMKVQKKRETLRSSEGGVSHVSDVRIVLLGYKTNKKCSSGNTILGRQEFDTVWRTFECVKREGERAGRHITVVEAPGWLSSYTVAETAERDKREIILSVSLCPPGPHVILLLFYLNISFTEKHRNALQEHMEILGERVWSHTIVLFTEGNLLEDTSIEQHIESGGEALQWVVEKCGNRYHVFDNKKRDGGQVTELLEKIEEMVAGNRGCHYDYEVEVMKDLMEKKNKEKRKAEERQMKVKKQREILRSSAGGVPNISHIRIVLLGYRGGGKSSSGNTILGRKEFDTVGRTAECVMREGETAGRHITLVDKPGWFHSSTLTTEHDKREIILSASLCPPGPHALLLAINANRSFTETFRRAVQEHLELLGERVWSHTIVLFTRGDLLGETSIEQHIESEGEALQWVVEKCGNRYHVVDNKKSDGGQVTELLEKIEEMVARNSGEWSMDDRPEFSEGLPDDYSRDSAYDSKSSSEHDLLKPLKTLSMADSTQSSGFGSAETGQRSGSAKTSLPIIPQTGVGGGVKIKGAVGGEGKQKSPFRQTHGETLHAKHQYFKETINFVDEGTITVDHTSCIGHGSYGKVHRGSYQGTPAAVKIIAVGNRPVTANEFIIPGRLSHPNIVRMMAVAKSETQILIANEYIHGANLQQVLHTDTPIKLQPEDKLYVALDIAMAVEYIHGKRIIHQDLKPANIMISAETKKAYLTDWGLANLKETVSMTVGGCGAMGGTPSYMARECLVECQDCSTMSDMWSLGITLLEMFTNSKPWSYVGILELRRLLHKRKTPHAMDKLQPLHKDIVKPLVKYEPKSRMKAKDMVILLKSKVDVTKRYGYTW